MILTSVTPASSAPVLQTPKATSSTLYFDSLTVNAGNGGVLHCIQMDTSVNAANQLVSVGADIAFDVFFSSRRRHTRFDCDWSSDVCSSDLGRAEFLTLLSVEDARYRAELEAVAVA